MIEYLIREAEPGDVSELVRMRRALQEHISRANPHLFGKSDTAAAELTGKYVTAMADANATVLVTHNPSTKRIVGMGVGTIVRREDLDPAIFGKIDDVWVDPDLRCRGICRRILAGLLEFFHCANIEHLVLDYVIGSIESERTWHRLGFHPVITKATAKLDEVRKSLDSASIA